MSVAFGRSGHRAPPDGERRYPKLELPPPTARDPCHGGCSGPGLCLNNSHGCAFTRRSRRSFRHAGCGRLLRRRTAEAAGGAGFRHGAGAELAGLPPADRPLRGGAGGYARRAGGKARRPARPQQRRPADHPLRLHTHRGDLRADELAAHRRRADGAGPGLRPGGPVRGAGVLGRRRGDRRGRRCRACRPARSRQHGGAAGGRRRPAVPRPPGPRRQALDPALHLRHHRPAEGGGGHRAGGVRLDPQLRAGDAAERDQRGLLRHAAVPRGGIDVGGAGALDDGRDSAGLTAVRSADGAAAAVRPGSGGDPHLLRHPDDPDPARAPGLRHVGPLAAGVPGHRRGAQSSGQRAALARRRGGDGRRLRDERGRLGFQYADRRSGADPPKGRVLGPAPDHP